MRAPGPVALHDHAVRLAGSEPDACCEKKPPRPQRGAHLLAVRRPPVRRTAATALFKRLGDRRSTATTTPPQLWDRYRSQQRPPLGASLAGWSRNAERLPLMSNLERGREAAQPTRVCGTYSAGRSRGAPGCQPPCSIARRAARAAKQLTPRGLVMWSCWASQNYLLAARGAAQQQASSGSRPALGKVLGNLGRHSHAWLPRAG